MIVLKKLYRNKYRPKNIEGTILLPRIANEIINENGEFILANHYLFSGTPGIGKTTLAKVIVPEGALIVNASYNSSIEDLKEQVIDYCRTSDIFNDSTIDGYKIVFLDEFDGVSQKYQEALRAFMEEYDDRVRFIATCNNLSKISPAMQSRFTVFKFDPENEEEINYLKEQYLERALLIKEKNNIQIDDEQIKSVININFPDLRSVFNTLQRAAISGGYTKDMNTSINVDLYNIIFEKPDPEKTYAWVMNNFGDNVENLLKMCARPLSTYIFEHKKTSMNKVPMIMKIVAGYTTNLSTCVDPVILALSCIYEIQEIINNK